MLAIKHRHDDHNRLSTSGNLFFDVWHHLPFKKKAYSAAFENGSVYRHDRSGLQRRLLGYRHRRFVVVDPLGLTMCEKCMKTKFTS